MSINQRDHLERLFEAALTASNEQEYRELLEAIAEGRDGIVLDEALTSEDNQDEIVSNESLYAMINDMSIPEKIKLALLGNQTARSLLIKDTNRQIPLFVLENPRLTEAEALEFAKNTNLDEQVHRRIALNSQWMKNYSMKIAIVSNPKVPIDTSLKWVKYLNTKDLRRLSRSKNIPNVIATQCTKLLEKGSK